MMIIKTITDDMPGRAAINPSIVRRNRGANASARNTRKMRSARNTDNPSDAGTNEIPTIKKSNRFQGSRKNDGPLANNFKANSTTKIAKHILSNVCNNPPYCAVIDADVSIPKIIALIKMIAKMLYRMRGVSSHSANEFRNVVMLIF